MVRIFSQENQCLSKCLKDKEKQHGKDYPGNRSYGKTLSRPKSWQSLRKTEGLLCR